LGVWRGRAKGQKGLERRAQHVRRAKRAHLLTEMVRVWRGAFAVRMTGARLRAMHSASMTSLAFRVWTDTMKVRCLGYFLTAKMVRAAKLRSLAHWYSTMVFKMVLRKAEVGGEYYITYHVLNIHSTTLCACVNHN
jgi:hypothetical protein